MVSGREFDLVADEDCVSLQPLRILAPLQYLSDQWQPPCSIRSENVIVVQIAATKHQFGRGVNQMIKEVFGSLHQITGNLVFPELWYLSNASAKSVRVGKMLLSWIGRRRILITPARIFVASASSVTSASIFPGTTCSNSITDLPHFSVVAPPFLGH